MTVVEREIEARWADWLVSRNRRGARIVLWLVAIFYPFFGVLDWLVAPPDMLPLLYSSRAAVTAITIAMFWVVRSDLFERRSDMVTAFYALVLAAGIAVMVFALGGYQSPYYAGLSLVIVTTGLLFLWPARVAAVTHATVVLCYLVPNAFTATTDQLLSAVTSFFFLATTAVIVVAAQILMYRSQHEQVTGKLMLERITAEREEALARLQELDRAKSMFFSNITHELRTPLTMILSPLESMLSGDLGSFRSEQKLYLRNVWRNALKLLKLINDLLDMAKIEERFLKLSVARGSLVPLLEEIVEHAQPLAARKDIALILEVRHDSQDLWTDLERMERVFINLLSNALKFTEANGRVSIVLDRGEGGEVTVAFSDSGIGIAPDKLGKVFERFSQADESTTRRFGGTGIGLALVKELVELHGGTIDVESAVGRGSTFTVRLREGREHLGDAVTEATLSGDARDFGAQIREGRQYRFQDIEEATERRIAERGDDSTKSTKVLVVEDTVELLRFIHIQLQEEHAVYLALNGKLGLELAKREMPDLIVTDYMMPEMDGVAMITALRQDPKTAEIPIVMLTAKNAVEDRLAAHGAGADVYLNKPFSPRELRAVIAQLLGKRGRQATTVMKAQARSLEIISAGLAHELHNPLSYLKNAVLTTAESAGRLLGIMRDETLSPAERDKALQKANQKIERMLPVAEKGIQRIESVVALVRRYAREGYPEEPTETPLDRAVSDVVELIAPKSDKSVSLTTNLGCGDAAVLVIPEELHQTIRNLVQNAIDAVGDGGSVRLSTRTADGGKVAVIEVADDGPGIPKDVMPRIFTPFFSTKGPGKGMGVGLSIALQVVEQAGGTIDVRNAAEGGAVFTVRIPTIQVAAQVALAG
ncbi:MAG: hypothetical protein AMXMBFR64_38180 [Myxococcales bacterium]